MRKIFLLLVLVLSNYVLHSQSAANQEAIELPEELSRVLREYEKYWRDFDSKGLASLFTEDGFILRPFREPTRGRELIEKAYNGAGGPLFLSAYAYHMEDNIAYIIGGYRGVEDGKDSGKFTLTFQKLNDKWFIFSDMDNGNSR